MRQVIFKQVDVFNKKTSTTEKRYVKYLSERIENVEQLKQLLDTSDQQEISKACKSRKVSNEQKKAVKTRLVQIVTQTLGNPDGTLAGSKTLLDIVAGDFDGILEKDAPAFEQKVLSLKDELGLLWFTPSASIKQNAEREWVKGYHIYVSRKTELTQEENLQRLGEIIGVEPDPAAKDITRVMFECPSDNWLYIDPRIFEENEVEPAPGETFGKKASRKTVKKAVKEVKKAIKEASTIRRESEYAFKEICKLAGLDIEEIDKEGYLHNNLLALLSKGLPTVLTREEIEECLEHFMPSYSGCDDCETLLNYFYDNYDADKRIMSGNLVKINASLQNVSEAKKEETETTDSFETELPPPMPEKLPRIIELLVKRFEPQYRPMLAIAAVAYLAALASHFRGLSVERRVVGGQMFVAITAKSGSGKQYVQDVFNMITKNTLQPIQDSEFEKFKQNREERIYNPEERIYKPVLPICERASASSIFDMQDNIGKNGMLLLNYEEADQLVQMNKQAFSDLSVYLRKAWDGRPLSQKYVGQSSINFNGDCRATCVCTGTLEAVLGGLHRDTSNGLTNRFITILLESDFNPFTPVIDDLSKEDQVELDDLLIGLFEKNQALGEDTELLDLSGTREMIKNWQKENAKKFFDGTYNEADQETYKRLHLQMLKAAITLVAQEGKETPEIIEFARWIGEMAFFYSRLLFRKRIERDQKKGQAMIGYGYRPTPTKGEFDAMPNIFTRKQFYEYREKEGKTAGSSKTLLLRKVKEGKLIRLSDDLFKKAS